MPGFTRATSGLPGLDAVLNGLQMGDNVVLQVDDIADYATFVTPFVSSALDSGRRVVYIRFAGHAELVKDKRAKVYVLDASRGFEAFSTEVHNIATEEGRGVFYVFDCLSWLLEIWATDLMIGNFFVITCPYLFELNTIAYFALKRGDHSFKTVARIRETTQVLLDVYNSRSRLCVHPLKAWKRYSPTMFMPHIMEGEAFVPILNSAEAADFFSYLADKNLSDGTRNLDYWDRIFMKASQIQQEKPESIEASEMVDVLLRVMIGREERMLSLAERFLTLDDLLEIRKRMIGTGFIGGKSTGMLLARAILRKNSAFNWNDRIEIHDSFYIGSDIFYSYIVQNGWWRMLMTQKTDEGYFETAAELGRKMLTGTFPDEIREQFQLMLEYYGQAPIIVRSSSLLEDAFGNAFAGKYESFFLVNQGSPEERYAAFEDAVRKVYASTMSRDALEYRLKRGMAHHDEQMSLLVMRVSGVVRGSLFYPDMAGVGLSRNIFLWSGKMSPEAGMIRIVFGLGTRAVNRVESDYPRIAALDAPLVRPYSGLHELSRYSQRQADVLDIERNSFESVDLKDLLAGGYAPGWQYIFSVDPAAAEFLRSRGRGDEEARLVTFDGLLGETDFTELMSGMMKELELGYGYPVDIEFTGNFAADGRLMVNLLQCRPFQGTGNSGSQVIPENIPAENVFIRQNGNFMGGSISRRVDRLILVDPAAYSALNAQGKHEAARAIGRINRLCGSPGEMNVMLAGPGRWGTTTPAMGVPVRFSEINNVSFIAEVAYRHGDLVPDLSYGTHFFQDMVEMEIFYMAVYPEDGECEYNLSVLEGVPDVMEKLLPGDSAFADVIKVYDFGKSGCKSLRIVSDAVKSSMICFFEENAGAAL